MHSESLRDAVHDEIKLINVSSFVEGIKCTLLKRGTDVAEQTGLI